jgi:hypothetical protein
LTEANRSHPGFSIEMVSGKGRTVDESIEILKNAIGRQIYWEVRIANSEELLIN